jgi:N-acetylmuramic acid 6-phosphate etherase
VVLFGAGTSGRLAALDAAELRPTFGIAPERDQARIAGGAGAFASAREGAEDDRGDGADAAADLKTDDVAVGIAASGRTPWVLAALEQARARSAATIGLACVPNPALAPLVDVLVSVDTGPEPIWGSTRMKAGTAQKMVLNSFSSTLMVHLGKVYGNLMVDVRATNEKLWHRAVRLVQAATGVNDATARQYLAEASGDVKTAITMLRLEIPLPEARRRLSAADGQLRLVLGKDR